jgi:NAD-dependent SIR2 family protein deacetylase
LTSLFPENYLDYGVDFANFNELDDWKRPNEDAVKLYKIHGSLNWLYCPTCNNLWLTPKEKGVIKLLAEDSYSLKEAVCRKCKTIYSPIIVPPTFFKDFTNVFLNLVLNKAEQSLLEAKHLIFCGYSFPDADMHIKYLIKRVQKNRMGAALKITVVNNHKGKRKARRDDEKNRFERFLGQTVHYTKFSFEQFARKPELLIT